MSKQYRKELRAIETQIRRASRDRCANTKRTALANAKILRAAERRAAQIDREATREICANNRLFKKLDKGTVKQLAAFQKRRSILVGRLS